jgi:hypothetical protein
VTSLVEQHAPVWAPFGDWLSTPEGREELSLNLAATKVARFVGLEDDGMDGYIASVLAKLATHLTAEERWAAFEDLVASVRRRASAFTDDQTAAACAGVDDAIRRLCGGAA